MLVSVQIVLKILQQVRMNESQEEEEGGALGGRTYVCFHAVTTVIAVLYVSGKESRI